MAEEGQWSASPPTLHRWCLTPEQGGDVEEDGGGGARQQQQEEQQLLRSSSRDRNMEKLETWKRKAAERSSVVHDDDDGDYDDDDSGLELCLGLSLGGSKSNSKSSNNKSNINKSNINKEKEKEKFVVDRDRHGFGGKEDFKDSHGGGGEHASGGSSGDKKRDGGMEGMVSGKTVSLEGGGMHSNPGSNGEQKGGGGGGRMQAFWQQDFSRSSAVVATPEKMVSASLSTRMVVPSPPPQDTAAEDSRRSVENAVAEDSKSFARNIWHALQEKAAQPEHQRLPLTVQDEVSLIKELQGLPPHAVATAAAWARFAAQGAIPAQLLEAFKDRSDPMSQLLVVQNAPSINSLSSGLNCEVGLPVAAVPAAPPQAAAATSVPPSNGELAQSDSDLSKNVTMADQQQRQAAMLQQQQQELVEQQRKHVQTQKRQEARKKRKMLIEGQKQMKKAKKEDERPMLSGALPPGSTNGKPPPSGNPPNQLRRANSSQPPSPPVSSPLDSQDVVGGSSSLTAFSRPGSSSWSSHNWGEAPAVEASAPLGSGPAPSSSLTGKLEKHTAADDEGGNRLLEIRRALQQQQALQQQERDRSTKDRGRDSETAAAPTESADSDLRKANVVPDLTYPHKLKIEDGAATITSASSGKMGGLNASFSAPLTAGMTIAGMPYPHNPAFPLMHVPYPFPITVPAAAAAGGVPFSLPFPFPYVMQFAPAATSANGDGSQEQQRPNNSSMPNPFQITVPPMYSPFQIQTPEGAAAAWTPAVVRPPPHLTPPHSPPRNAASTLTRTKSGTPHEDESLSSQDKGNDHVKSRDMSPVQEQSSAGVHSLLRAGSLGSGAFNRLGTPPSANPVPPAHQFVLSRTKSDAVPDRLLRREASTGSAFASVVDASQGGAHIQGSRLVSNNGLKVPVSQGGGTTTRLERAGSRVPAMSADEAGTLVSGRPGTPGDSAQSGITAITRSASSVDEDKAFHPTGVWQQGSLPSLDGLAGEEASSLRPGFAVGQHFGGTGSPPDLPWVTCNGTGPSGKTISGVLYRVEKGQVKIVCACHGRHMSPAEFVQHAGGGEMSNPEKAIVVGPFTIPTQTAASAQA